MSTNELIKKAIAYPAFLAKLMKWKLGFCRRLRAHDPIFVYQMGKVSSRSIYEPLYHNFNGAVIHGHALNARYPSGDRLKASFDEQPQVVGRQSTQKENAE